MIMQSIKKVKNRYGKIKKINQCINEKQLKRY